MVDLLLAVVLVVIATAAGRWLLEFARVRCGSFSQEAFISFGLGLGLLCYLTFLGGIVGVLYRAVAFSALLVLALAVRRHVVHIVRFVARGISALRTAKWSLTTFLLASVLLVTALLNLIGSLAPPTEADTLAYHFAYPKLFLRAHKIIYIPDFVANAPLNQHMLYTMAMLLSGDILASLIVYAEGLALVAAMILFCRKHLRLEVGLLAAVLMYTMPVVTYMAGSGMVELGLTLFTFLAFWAFYEWTQTMETRGLILAAIFTGLAVGTKYYGLISLVAFGLLIPVSLFLSRRFSLKKLLVVTSLFGWISVGVGSPWYIRNAINTGNPIYPAFYEIFGGRDWSPELDKAFKSLMAKEKRRGGNDLLGYIFSPWNMTIHGDRFGEARAGLGPAFLAFGPVILWLFFRTDGSEKVFFFYAVLFAFIFFTLWFWAGIQRQRHLLPAIPGMSIATAMSTFILAKRTPLMKAAAASAVVMALLFNVAGNVIFNGQFVPVVLGAVPADVYLEARIPGYRDIVWINGHLKGDGKILHFVRTNNYYLNVGYLFASTVSQGRLDWARIQNVDELLRDLKAEGLSHVWIDEKSLVELAASPSNTSSPVASMNQRMAILVVELVRNHGVEVYRNDRMTSQFRTFSRGKQEISSRIYQIK